MKSPVSRESRAALKPPLPPLPPLRELRVLLGGEGALAATAGEPFQWLGDDEVEGRHLAAASEVDAFVAGANVR